MRNLIIIGFLLVSVTSVKAAKILKIQETTSPALIGISKELSVLTPFKKTDIQFKEYSFKYNKSLDFEEVQKVIELAIHKEYSEEYSRPEFVHVMGLRKKDFRDELAVIVEPFEIYAKLKGLSELQIQDALLKIDHLIQANSELKIFTLSQGNMFGEGVGIILFDKSHKEFLVLERLYQE